MLHLIPAWAWKRSDTADPRSVNRISRGGDHCRDHRREHRHAHDCQAHAVPKAPRGGARSRPAAVAVRLDAGRGPAHAPGRDFDTAALRVQPDVLADPLNAMPGQVPESACDSLRTRHLEPDGWSNDLTVDLTDGLTNGLMNDLMNDPSWIGLWSEPRGPEPDQARGYDCWSQARSRAGSQAESHVIVARLAVLRRAAQRESSVGCPAAMLQTTARAAIRRGSTGSCRQEPPF